MVKWDWFSISNEIMIFFVSFLPSKFLGVRKCYSNLRESVFRFKKAYVYLILRK